MLIQTTTAQAEEILALQKQAYQSEALLYPDLSLPRMTQTLDQFKKEISRQRVLFFMNEGMIIGSVSGEQQQHDWEISRLIVEPMFQGQGIGSRLLKAMEGQSPINYNRLTLFTGHKSIQNLKMYLRRGCLIYKKEQLEPNLILIHLAKGIHD